LDDFPHNGRAQVIVLWMCAARLRFETRRIHTMEEPSEPPTPSLFAVARPFTENEIERIKAAPTPKAVAAPDASSGVFAQLGERARRGASVTAAGAMCALSLVVVALPLGAARSRARRHARRASKRTEVASSKHGPSWARGVTQAAAFRAEAAARATAADWLSVLAVWRRACADVLEDAPRVAAHAAAGLSVSAGVLVTAAQTCGVLWADIAHAAAACSIATYSAVTSVVRQRQAAADGLVLVDAPPAPAEDDGWVAVD